MNNPKALRINNLYSYISYLAEKYPNNPAVISYDDSGSVKEKISYALLKEKLESFVGLLLRNNLLAGDSCAIALRNSSELLLLSWAAWCVGITTVPLDMKKDTLNEHIYKINLSKAKIIVTKNNELNGSEKKSLGKKVKIINLDSVNSNNKGNNLPWKSSLNHRALILFTSGTTAHPKGVKLSLENLVVNAEGIKKWLRIRSVDRFIVNLPLHHINSTTFCLSTLLAGGSIAIFSNYSNSRFWERIAISVATLTSIVPSICFDQLSRQKEFNKFRDRIKLSRIQIGSAPVVVSDVKKFMNLFNIPLYQGYGQTETALRVTGVPLDLDKKTYEKLIDSNSIGKPMDWAKVEIMDEDGVILGEGEDGEIGVKGKAVMEGYIGIKEGFRNGYFLTGDIGYFKIINSERYFFLKGRKKEIIIKGGINISPVAVENKLKKISSDIDQAYVIGVDDKRCGEEVGAVVCWKKGINVEKAKTSLKYKLIQGSKHISFYESPQYIASFEPQNLPMTSTGKIQRSILKNKINSEDFEQTSLIYKNSNYRFFYLLTNSLYFTEAFNLYNYCWDPLRLETDEFKKQIKNGSAIIVLDNNNKVKGLILLVRTGISEETLSSISYSKLISLGQKSVASGNRDSFVCIAICSSNYKPYDIPKINTKPTAEDVKKYLFSGHDGVYNFHTKAKGGLDNGAKLAAILPNARPEDKSSLGFNMLMKYPKIDKSIKINEDAPISVQLIEVVMWLAWNIDVKTVYAFSRPAGLAKYLSQKETE